MKKSFLIPALLAVALLGGCGQSTPFDVGIIKDPEKVASLLKSGLDPESKNNSQYNQDSLLCYAVRHKATASAKVILDAGAEVDRRTSGYNKTALFQAAYNGDIATANVLIAAGADVNAADMFGELCIREAILAGHAEMVKYLLDRGINTRNRNRDGQTPAEIAAEFGSPEIKELFRQ